MDELYNMFEQSCKNKAFEKCAQQAHKEGKISIPIYLSLGTEHIPAIILNYCKDAIIFPQHRCHSWLLSAGAPPELMIKELLGRNDGINKGMAGSPSMSWKPNVFGHSGLLGDQIPIAVGAAHASNKLTVCICGDAAIEEDYALGAIGYAATKKTPVLFVVEDNNLSILTEKKVRRCWDIIDTARGMGISAIECNDTPGDIIYNTRYLLDQLPALINIHVKREVWHCGSGVDGIEIDNTMEEKFRNLLQPRYTAYSMKQKENDINIQMDILWKRLLTQ